MNTPQPRLTHDAAARARRVRWVLLDVDGVLTDGRIVFEGGAAVESKHFDSQDGVGVKIAQRGGLHVGLITGRRSPALERRAAELGIAEVATNALHKEIAYARLLARHRLSDGEVAFVGDDIVDLPPMRRAGLAVAVPNACREVLGAAHFVTARAGGRGAVREILDFILKVQGRWDRATRGFVR